MQKEILYVTALNTDGKLIKANDAVKKENYFCPVCKGELILKKSGKTGKGSKRPHFAHKTLTPNCTPEGVLHYSFKELLFDKIQSCIANKIPIPVKWECTICHLKHEYNLIQNITEVKKEFPMKTCRPDIALFSKGGNVLMAIEIVVTHSPEAETLQYYHENKIILVQINLETEDDLNNIDTKIATPAIIDFCFNPKCQTGEHYRSKRVLGILPEKCLKCGNFNHIPILKGCVITDYGFYTQNPNYFFPEEIQLAQNQGVCFSQTNNELKYDCPRCKKRREFTSRTMSGYRARSSRRF